MNFGVEWSVKDLLPHRGSMLLVDKVRTVNLEKSHIICSAVVREDSLFLRHGNLQMFSLVEYMAQTMAAFVGYRGRKCGESSVHRGYLVGARNLEFEEATMKVGDELFIDVKEDATFGDYGSYLGTVLFEDNWVCRGCLKVFLDRST